MIFFFDIPNFWFYMMFSHWIYDRGTAINLWRLKHFYKKDHKDDLWRFLRKAYQTTLFIHPSIYRSTSYINWLRENVSITHPEFQWYGKSAVFGLIDSPMWACNYPLIPHERTAEIERKLKNTWNCRLIFWIVKTATLYSKWYMVYIIYTSYTCRPLIKEPPDPTEDEIAQLERKRCSAHGVTRTLSPRDYRATVIPSILFLRRTERNLPSSSTEQRKNHVSGRRGLPVSTPMGYYFVFGNGSDLAIGQPKSYVRRHLMFGHTLIDG